MSSRTCASGALRIQVLVSPWPNSLRPTARVVRAYSLGHPPRGRTYHQYAHSCPKGQLFVGKGMELGYASWVSPAPSKKKPLRCRMELEVERKGWLKASICILLRPLKVRGRPAQTLVKGAAL